MSHDHANCTSLGCSSGMLYDYCDWEDCTNSECMVVGHCSCLCHSGKRCICGHHNWPKMEKQ